MRRINTGEKSGDKLKINTKQASLYKKKKTENTLKRSQLKKYTDLKKILK